MPIDSLTKDLHSDYSPNDDLWFIYGRFLLRVLYDQMALRVKNVLPIGLLCYQCVTTWLFLCYHRPSKSSVSWWILTCYAITPYWVFDPRMCYRRPPCGSQKSMSNDILFFLLNTNLQTIILLETLNKLWLSRKKWENLSTVITLKTLSTSTTTHSIWLGLSVIHCLSSL